MLAERNEITAAILDHALTADDIHVVRGPSSVAALEPAAARAAPHVVVIGPDFPRHDLGPTVTRMLTHGTRTLVLSDAAFDEQSAQLLLAGASGYLLATDTGLADVAAAIRAVASGTSALHPAVVELVLGRWRALQDSPPTEPALPARVPALSARELEVLLGLRDGLTNRMIAKRLGIAEKTVEAHKSRLYAKLGARTPPHAVRLGIELRLI